MLLKKRNHVLYFHLNALKVNAEYVFKSAMLFYFIKY